jgi:hypothetical protein
VVLVECRTAGRVAQVKVVGHPAGWVGLLGAATVSASAGPGVTSARP